MARTKPHAKIHISVAHHPRTEAVWSDPRLRGMLVEVWRLAMERYAGKTNDTVGLRPLDRLSISGESTLIDADRSLVLLFRTLKYRVRKYPNRWDVHIRNLAEKHGFSVQESTDDKQQNGTHKKEERREKKEERREKKEGTEINTPAARALGVWPNLVEASNRSGGAWKNQPGTAQLKIIAARIRDGATESQLVDAVLGYIRRHGTEAHDGFDPMASFTATTIFRASKFDANVEAASRPARARAQPKPTTAQVKQDALHDSARGALEIWEQREAAKVLGDGRAH